MSNQKSVFESPEQLTPKQRNDYAQYTQSSNVLRRNRGWIALVAIIALLFIGITVIRAFGDHLNKTINEPTINYSVSSAPKIIVHADAGDVHIHSGSGSSIVIKATKHLGIFDNGTSNPDITTQQNGNTINITTTVETYFSLLGGGRSYVSLDITLPSTSNVQLTEGAGNITVDDVSGQMAIHNQAGDITLNDSRLSGSSSLISDAGNIQFDGSLDQHGSYQFTTQAGNVTLTLPSNSSLNLHTQVTAGHIQNAFGDGATGSAPQAPVNVSTTAGNITINKD